MEWYAAHTMIAFRRDDGVGPISVFENIYIICAESHDIANQKANDISALEIKSNDRLNINSCPSSLIYGGVRKINNVINESQGQRNNILSDGSEISYLEYEFESMNDLEVMISGEPAVIKIIE